MYNTPLLDLVYKAASVHRMYNDPQMVSRLRMGAAHEWASTWLWGPGLAPQRVSCSPDASVGQPLSSNAMSYTSSFGEGPAHAPCSVPVAWTRQPGHAAVNTGPIIQQLAAACCRSARPSHWELQAVCPLACPGGPQQQDTPACMNHMLPNIAERMACLHACPPACRSSAAPCSPSRLVAAQRTATTAHRAQGLCHSVHWNSCLGRMWPRLVHGFAWQLHGRACGARPTTSMRTWATALTSS